jgi:hypothetical protein
MTSKEGLAMTVLIPLLWLAKQIYDMRHKFVCKSKTILASEGVTTTEASLDNLGWWTPQADGVERQE